MRYRVDFEYGYASFSEYEKEKAWKIFRDPAYAAIRIRKCENLNDEGIVLDGLPIYQDNSNINLFNKKWD